MAVMATDTATARGRLRLATDTATAKGLLRPSPATDTAMDMVTAMATTVENASKFFPSAPMTKTSARPLWFRSRPMRPAPELPPKPPPMLTTLPVEIP